MSEPCEYRRAASACVGCKWCVQTSRQRELYDEERFICCLPVNRDENTRKPETRDDFRARAVGHAPSPTGAVVGVSR